MKKNDLIDAIKINSDFIHKKDYISILESMTRSILKSAGGAKQLSHTSTKYKVRFFKGGTYTTLATELLYSVSITAPTQIIHGAQLNITCRHVPKNKKKTLFFIFTEEGLHEKSSEMPMDIQYNLILKVLPAFVAKWQEDLLIKLSVPTSIVRAAYSICTDLNKIDKIINYFEDEKYEQA